MKMSRHSASNVWRTGSRQRRSERGQPCPRVRFELIAAILILRPTRRDGDGPSPRRFNAQRGWGRAVPTPAVIRTCPTESFVENFIENFVETARNSTKVFDKVFDGGPNSPLVGWALIRTVPL